MAFGLCEGEPFELGLGERCQAVRTSKRGLGLAGNRCQGVRCSVEPGFGGLELSVANRRPGDRGGEDREVMRRSLAFVDVGFDRLDVQLVAEGDQLAGLEEREEQLGIETQREQAFIGIDRDVAGEIVEHLAIDALRDRLYAGPKGGDALGALELGQIGHGLAPSDVGSTIAILGSIVYSWGHETPM